MSKTNIYKCDRCGKTYELYSIIYPNIKLIGIKSGNKEITTIGDIDLCEKCYTELKTWFGKEVTFE